MSDATIDSLRIEIDANASKAASGLDSLISKLGQLNSAASPTTTSNLKNLSATLADFKKNSVSKATGTNLQTLVNAANGLSGSSVANLGSLTGNLKDLSTVKISKTIGTNLGRITTAASGVSNSSGVGNLASALKSGSSAMGGMKAQSDSLYTSLNNLANVIRTVSTLAASIEAVAQVVATAIDASNTYIEDMNLANTVLGEYADSAHELAESYQEIFGIDSGAFLRNMGTFDSMAQGMGVASDKAVLMSKNLAQLGYDLASYYNISNDAAMEKLRSGLAGEIEPLRALGFDLTSARLQQEAYNLGLNETVSNMTQAEKAMLRYQAIMNQVAWSHGDLAKTIQSPSNMLRVFQQNVTIAARSIGNAFLPMLQAILPVGIAVAKVLATVGNMIADLTGGTQIANMEFGDSGTTDATNALEDTADAEDNVGNSASGASSKVKELKRQLMGFDEINKFTAQSDSGSGGSGGGSGADTSAADATYDLSNYDWIGNGLGDDLYNQLMQLMNRCIAAIKPLGDAFGVLFTGIKTQMEGLDLAGAFGNMFVGAVSVVSNGARSIVEVLTPMILAFNFPETLALSFDLVAQLCVTLSSAINGVSSVAKGFVDTALAPIAEWLGEKVRGAIWTCLEVLEDWGNWFRDNVQSLYEIGTAAGSTAGGVLRLAAAVADAAFSAAAAIFKGISDALQGLLNLLINSGAAQGMAKQLGYVLGFLGVAAAVDAVTVAFGKLTGVIIKDGQTGKTVVAQTGQEVKSFGDKVAAVKAHISNVTTAMGDQIVKSTDLTNKTHDLNDNYRTTYEQLQKTTTAWEKQNVKLEDAKQKLKDYPSLSTLAAAGIEKIRTAHAKAETNVAKFNNKIAASKIRLNEQKTALSNSVKQTGLLSKETGSAVSAIAKEEASLALSTVQKTKAAVASKALAVAEGVAATATTVLRAALGGLGLMAISAALGVILQYLEPVTNGIRDAANWLASVCNNPITSFLADVANAMFGVEEATDGVTDATQEANDALEEEQQAINDNLSSIREYEKQNSNLKTALDKMGWSEQQLAQYMYNTGQSIDDICASTESYVDSIINGFDRIDTASSLTADELVSNLEANLQATREWSGNLKQLMAVTGLDSSNQFIQEFASGGAKYNETVKQLLANANGELDRFIAVANETGNDAGNMLVEGFSDGSSTLSTEVQQAIASGEASINKAGEVIYTRGKNAGKKLTTGVAEGASDTTQVKQAADTVGAVATEYGSHYNDAKDAGRNFTGGFGDGIAASDMVELARSKAKAVSDKANAAFNGGNGYQNAYSAGRNMTGGFGDGIANATTDATTKAQQVMTKAVQALNGGNGYNKAKDAGKNLGGGFGDGIKAASSQATTQAKSVSTAVTNALKANTSAARSSGSQVMQNFANGLKGYTSQASLAARNVSNSVSTALKSGQSTASSAGRTIVNNFVNGLRSSGSNASSAARSVANSANSGFTGVSSSAYSAGWSFGSGFAKGISASVSYVKACARSVAYAAIVTVRTSIRQGSPSKVMAESGKWFDLGFAQGMNDYASSVASAAKSMTQEALNASDVASDMGSEVGKAFGGGIADGIDAKEVAQVLAYANESTAAANAVNWSTGGGYSAAHASTGAVVDDMSVASILTSAVVNGLVSAKTTSAGSSAGSSGNTTIELKVDSQTLARAVMKGEDALARRGVLSFT